MTKKSYENVAQKISNREAIIAIFAGIGVMFSDLPKCEANWFVQNYRTIA